VTIPDQRRETGNPARIAMEDPAQPEIVALLRDGEAHSASLYPAESNHHLPLDALRATNVRFFAARNFSGGAIGTGAIVLNGAWAELKRMWVIPEARGVGVSRVILAALEACAHDEGVRTLRLETGVASHDALALYTRAGFERCDPFGDYRPDPLSVFMQKDISTIPEAIFVFAMDPRRDPREGRVNEKTRGEKPMARRFGAAIALGGAMLLLVGLAPAYPQDGPRFPKPTMEQLSPEQQAVADELAHGR